MNCKNIEGLLLLYLDNRLSKKKSLEIAKHLGECPKCKQILDEDINCIKALKELSLKEIPQELLENIKEKVQDQSKNPTPVSMMPGFLRTIASVATFAGLAIAILYVLDTENKVPAPYTYKQNIVSTNPEKTNGDLAAVISDINSIERVVHDLSAVRKQGKGNVGFRGAKPEESAAAMRETEISVKTLKIRLNKEIEAIIRKRANRLSTIDIFRKGLIAVETETGMLKISKANTLTQYDRVIIGEENADREKLIMFYKSEIRRNMIEDNMGNICSDQELNNIISEIFRSNSL